MRRILGAVLLKTVAVAGLASAVTVNLAIKRLRVGLPRRMISVLVHVGVVVGVAAAVILPSGAAQALGGFHTSGNSVRVRATASTQASQISFIPAAGTAIDIACQTAGQTVSLAGWGTSPIWDKLNGYGGGYISDLFVRETAYARFDPRLPQCGASPAPAASNQAPASLGGGVNMQGACDAQYPGQGLTATATDSKNAYSWKCVGSGVSRGIDVASQCRAQYGAGAVAAVANPASAWTWYCYTPASSSGEACVFNDPRLFFGLAGHVGWGFELPGGNWEFGANEGPKKWPLVQADVSITAAYTGSEATMLAWFINGGYARYRCVTVPAFNASAAEQQVSKEQNEPYVPPGSDCESQTDNVLREYGVKNLPNDVSDPFPNDWFNALPSAGFGGPTSL